MARASSFLTADTVDVEAEKNGHRQIFTVEVRPIFGKLHFFWIDAQMSVYVKRVEIKGGRVARSDALVEA
jgi:hypothetical protein